MVKSFPGFDGKISFPFFLAPMVGLSHVGLRTLVRSYLPSEATTLWPTEMLNSRRLPSQRLGETPETKKSICDSNIVPQILGNEEKFIGDSVKKLKDWGAVGIDINMGCPVQRALKHNYGVALMGDSDYAAKVVEMTAKATDLPVSVKLRAGPQGDADFLVKFVTGLKNAGAQYICLHPRTAEQKRRGRADWSQIRMIKESVRIPVIGNGDIQTADDAFSMINETHCDGVMMGRALTARPWLLLQIFEKLGHASPKKAPQGKFEEAVEYGNSLKHLFQILLQHFEESLAIRKFKFHVKVSQNWLNYGHQLEAKLSAAHDTSSVERVLHEFFQADGLEMAERSDFRY